MKICIDCKHFVKLDGWKGLIKFKGKFPYTSCRGKCGKKFTAKRECEVTYSTYKIKEVVAGSK